MGFAEWRNLGGYFKIGFQYSRNMDFGNSKNFYR